MMMMMMTTTARTTTARTTQKTTRCVADRRAASVASARARVRTIPRAARGDGGGDGDARGGRDDPASDASGGGDVPFGYTRKDVMLIGGGLTGAGYGAYYGLQSVAGLDAVQAGNAVQLTFVLGLTLAWVGSYVARVFNKDMTYVKQLKDYEDAVMQKRLEEMPSAELEKMMQDLDEK